MCMKGREVGTVVISGMEGYKWVCYGRTAERWVTNHQRWWGYPHTFVSVYLFTSNSKDGMFSTDSQYEKVLVKTFK